MGEVPKRKRTPEEVLAAIKESDSEDEAEHILALSDEALDRALAERVKPCGRIPGRISCRWGAEPPPKFASSLYDAPSRSMASSMPLLRDVAAARAWPLYAAAILSAAACGGNEFVYNPDAAGSPGDDAGGGADAGADTGGATAFCDALTAYFAHCQFNLPCDKRNLDNCGAFSYALSDVARSAFIACEESMSIQCARGGQAWERESCVSGKLAAATQTMAQSKLATDYCNACPQTATGVTCTPHTFFQQNPVSAALDGPGFDALLYNDTLVKSVDQMCTNARTCDAIFRICEGVYIQSQVPQDACGDGG